MEITSKLELDRDKLNQLEMHSFINLVTVVYSQLYYMQEATQNEELFKKPISEVRSFADSVRRKDDATLNEGVLEALIREITNSLGQADGQMEPDDYKEIRLVFDEIFDVMRIRFEELCRRRDFPNRWEEFSIEEFKSDFDKFFFAMEKNSRGRYRIIRNIADQEEKDYFINFDINSDLKDIILMPLLLKDVIRDLVANARKYTPPGGRISVGIRLRDDVLKIVIEDTGLGIPEDEIENAVSFGYRASNVKDTIRTMGGGFGLTKAYYVTKKLSGRFWLDSELNKGTRITVSVPLPDELRVNFTDKKKAVHQ